MFDCKTDSVVHTAECGRIRKFFYKLRCRVRCKRGLVYTIEYVASDVYFLSIGFLKRILVCNT